MIAATKHRIFEMTFRASGTGCEGKAKPNELGAGRSEKEIALVAVGVGGAVKRPPPSSVVAADDIVACRESVGAEVFRGRE